jgi:uncharacterized protein YggL (DUF469 family)
MPAMNASTVPSLSQRRLARLNRRQRKKLRVGEFQELGFWVELKFKSPLDEAALDAFCDAVYPALAVQGLQIGGLGGWLPLAETDGFVGTLGRGSVTEAQRDAAAAWLKAYPAVAEVRVSAWVDAWYPREEELQMRAA